MTSYGCPVRDVLNVKSVSGNNGYALLCCSNSLDSCYTPAPCATFRSMRFDDAKKECEGRGDRLCTREEIKSGDCCGSQCEFDRINVWLTDEAEGENTLNVSTFSLKNYSKVGYN